jgi:phage shock protein PspC (stress-responsive transcriptional regulator)
MSARVPFGRRLAFVLIPTPAQALTSFLLSVIIIIGAQSQRALAFIGIGDTALNVSRLAINGRVEPVLSSQISETAALITFWSAIGVVAYLVCWICFSLYAQARNELTLTTEYTNRGHWRGPYETLGLKAIGALGLLGGVASLKPGITLWLAMAGHFLAAPTTPNAIQALMAILGLAIQFYLILALVLVTFTPWYRAEAFTDEQ